MKGLRPRCVFVTEPSLAELALSDPEQRFRKARLPTSLRWLVGDGTAASGLPAEVETRWDGLRAEKRAAILPALAPPSREAVLDVVEPKLAFMPGQPFDAFALLYDVFFGLAWRLLFRREESPEVMRACRGLRTSALAASQALRGWHSHFAPYLDRSLRADPAWWQLLPGSRRTTLLARQRSLGVLSHEMLRDDASDVARLDLASLIRAWARHLDGVNPEDAARFAGVGLLLASFENSASVAAWLLWLLARHPEWSERQVCSREDTIPFQNCLNEALRLFPPVWSVERETRRDFQWKGQDFQAGTIFLISPWVQGRLRSCWDEPNRFLPDRWAGPQPAPGLFLPFGLGRRSCPGASFACQEIEIVLGLLLERYRFEAVAERPAPVPLFGITQRPRSVWLRAWLR